MKTLVKIFVYAVLTGGFVAGGYFAAKAATGDVTYSGTTMKFSTDQQHYIVITGADSVQFEAAGASFFVLHNPNGQSLVPVLGTPPIGWTSEVYYTILPTNASGGKWYALEGYPTIQISSEIPISVTAHMLGLYSLIENFVIGIAGLVVWLIALKVLSRAGFTDW